MSAAPIHIEELHAYVDGRLPAARRAAVEAYLAAYPLPPPRRRRGAGSTDGCIARSIRC